MISLVICSRQNNISGELLENISKTIGIPYELIVIDNSSNNYSIFSAYNLGAEKSRYDILCFMHEDVSFITEKWGSIVTECLSDHKVGIIGVAGSVVKTESISPWWIANGYNVEEYLRYNIIQQRENKFVHEKSICIDEVISNVVVLDGVWLCCRKSTWQEVKFDEKTFSGFHFYDLDFCLRSIELGYQNFVVNNILLSHRSVGTTNLEWIDAAITFHKKWKNKLPVSSTYINKEKNQNIRT